MDKNIFIILGNQLFDPKLLRSKGCDEVFMSEDFGLCTFIKHHKLKLYLFLTAMREYKDELERHDIKVHYFDLENRQKEESYIDFLEDFLKRHKVTKLNFFEIEDKAFEKDFIKLKQQKIELIEHKSPMFLFTREEFREFQGDKKTFRMANFYQHGRKKLNILVDDKNKPIGEKWSFDEENRKKLPKGKEIPSLPRFKESKHHLKVKTLVDKYFDDHPGEIKDIWFPVNRNQAKLNLKIFLEERIESFGFYEDAMVSENNFLFHSTLSPSLNIGLISPAEIIKETLNVFKKRNIPLNSTEGFIRQIIGWREFIRGIYQEKSEYQRSENYWKHTKKITNSWYEGSTGILPLDDCIKTTLKDGYHHHIPRLMIISNLMNMCEISPTVIYDWFMEMYIDSSDWVMVPNVYGMATYADGGLMSTKPYTCGSNYILKMSNYSRGDWCDVVDGLYWRFTEKHRSFYEKNARSSFLIRTLDRLNPDRKKIIFEKAELFIKENTI
ncbi:MAG: cryptochrome/photolyase family protein [Gammaproteobacteria bacterium]